MKTAEEVLKSKLDMKIAIVNNPDYTFNKVIEAMEEYAKQFNPNRIDEERFIIAWNNPAHIAIENVLKEYNSTLPEIKQLEPLPSDMPKWLNIILCELLLGKKHDIRNAWNRLKLEYGTPKREWWMDLKEGEKFMFINPKTKEGSIETFYKAEIHARLFIDDIVKVYCDSDVCTPYIEPTTREKLLATMTDEQKELLKQWEAERC